MGRAPAAVLAVAVAVAVATVALGAGCSRDEPVRPPGTTGPPPATEPTTTTTEVPEAAGRAAVPYVPVAGECFDERTRADPSSGQPSTYVLVVACTAPHEQEVFAVVEHPGAGAPFPGDDPLRRYARLECPRRFGDYVGMAYELSRYGLGYVLPTADQWAAGERRVGCTVVNAARRTSGSARGANA